MPVSTVIYAQRGVCEDPGMPVIRRLLLALCVLVLTAGCTPGALPDEQATTSAGTDNAKADAVMRVVRDTMASEHLKSVIVRVTVDGQEVVTEALGESMTGVPATTNMHFRNGAVAISYVSTLLLKLVDEQKVSLDDKLSKFLPEIPHADKVTLGQLAQMTSGYVDYVIGNTKMNDALYADPFRRWTVHELLQFAVDQPLLYEPGTNWNYAHTNYVLLGLALEKATGQEMPKLLSEKVLRPLGLTNTANSLTAGDSGSGIACVQLGAPRVPQDSRRHTVLRGDHATGIRPGPSPTVRSRRPTSTTWRQQRSASVRAGSCRRSPTRRWCPPIFAARPTNSPAAPPASSRTRATPTGSGSSSPATGCCRIPMFAGYAAAEAYLPSQKVAIAVAVTYAPEAFDDSGDYPNAAEMLFRKIGAELAPDDAPPMPPAK